MTENDRRHVLEVLEILEQAYPEARIALNFSTPLELLVATILSAQCTDVRVNEVTPVLFRKYSDAQAYAEANQDELEQTIRPTGFFRNKASSLIGCGQILQERFGGRVPDNMEDLIQLPGVGRKTANVILGNAYGKPGIVVDTHVKRVSARLGWTAEKDPEKIERDLSRLLPRQKWTHASHVLIFHGRNICKAPVPLCSTCPVLPHCPRIGVNKSR